MKRYGFFCWLRRHKRGAPDMKAYALVGVVVDFCNTCSRDHLADLDLDALRTRALTPGSPGVVQKGERT